MMPGGRSFLILALCLAAGALSVLSAQNPAPTPQFRAGVDVFEFEVSVLDRNREPVGGLTAANFSVVEAGKPQPIVGFSEVEFPEAEGRQSQSTVEIAPDVTSRRYADRRLFVLVMDDWGMPEGALNFQAATDAKAIGKAFIDRLGPSDFAAVVLTRDTRFFPDFTNDRWKLTGAINELKPPEGAERAYLSMATHGHIGGPAALRDIADYLSKLPQHRKAIIYISMGQSMRAGTESFDRSLDVIKIAREAGIPIYPIDPSGLSVRISGGLEGLKTLAENTGGVAFVNTSDIRTGIQQIFHETRSYYLIGVQQTGPSDGKFRKMEVRVNRPGLTAYTRTGRYAPGAPDMVKGAPVPYDEAVDQAVEALAKATERRAATYAVLRPGALSVVVEIGAVEAATPRWSHGADVDVRITRGGGQFVAVARGRIAQTDRGVMLEVPLKDASGEPVDQSPGTFHVSARVTSDAGSLEDGTDSLGAGVLLGEPLVFRGVASPRVPLRPVAEFVFGRTERMRLDFPVLKPLTERRIRLLRRNGEALTVNPEISEQNGGLSVDLNPSFLAPGDYVIELFVRGGTEAERKLVAFRVR